MRGVSDRGAWQRRLYERALRSWHVPAEVASALAACRPLVLYDGGVRVKPYAGWLEVEVDECGRGARRVGGMISVLEGWQ